MLIGENVPLGKNTIIRSSNGGRLMKSPMPLARIGPESDVSWRGEMVPVGK
jgi:hypothetical protein